MDCPTCGDSFDTTSGMKIHHARSHGESISGKLVTCDSCGDEFRRKKSHIRDNNFCSKSCESDWKSSNMIGKSNPSYNGGMVLVNCSHCSSDLKRKQSVVEKQNNFFCDQNCQGQWRSDNLSGENSWAYKDGSSLDNYYNTREWKNFRHKMAALLDTSCSICDSSNKRQNALHHIIRMGDFEDRENANHINNVVFLCQSHHMELENLPADEQLERLNSEPNVLDSMSKLNEVMGRD